MSTRGLWFPASRNKVLNAWTDEVEGTNLEVRYERDSVSVN